MNNRYQLVKAIVFDGVLVPFWKCEYSYRGGYEEFYFSDIKERSSIILDGLWDCDKEEFVSFFTIENKRDHIPIGTVVAFEGEHGKFSLETIKEVKYDQFENYYEKYKDCKARTDAYCSQKNITIPENTKTIIWRYYNPTYIFESGKSTEWAFKVKEIEC